MSSALLTLVTTVLAAGGWTVTSAYAARLSQRLHTDELTGIGNRAALTRLARRASHSRGLVGVLMVDLDQFKVINDTYGHPFGNRVLGAVAARLATTAARWETPVRLHGDEFALWLGTTTF